MTYKVFMKINIDLKKFSFTLLFTKTCFIFFLSFFVPTSLHAENIADLQKNASIAYEKMMQTKQSADIAAKDAVFAEKKLASIRNKLAAAEKAAADARKKSEQAKISMAQAISRWQQATDALASEWGKTETK